MDKSGQEPESFAVKQDILTREPTRVLVLGEESHLRNTLADILQTNGLEPLLLRTGEQALKAASEQEVAIALINLHLEDMSGLTVLRTIKERSPSTECILLTDSAAQDSAIEAINLGAYAYFQKPLPPQQLFLAINRALEKRQAEKALRDSEEQYRQLFEMESDAIFLIENNTGQILQANTAASLLYGYSHEELLALKNTDLSAEPDRTRQVTQETPLAADEMVTVPLRWHRKKDGAVFPVEITGRFFTWRGRPVHIAAIRDISRRVQAEQEVRRSEARLRSVVSILQTPSKTKQDFLDHALDEAVKLTGSKIGYL